MNPRYYLILVLLYSYSFAQAAEMGLDWNTLQLSGMGCPAGNVKRDPLVGGDGLKIGFDQYDLRKGQKRKACQMVLPFALPKNQRLTELSITVSGTAKLLQGKSLQAKAEIFIVNDPNIQSELRIDINKDGAFKKSHQSTIQGQCGVASNLRVQSSLLASTAQESGEIQEMILTVKAGPCQ